MAFSFKAKAVEDFIKAEFAKLSAAIKGDISALEARVRALEGHKTPAPAPDPAPAVPPMPPVQSAGIPPVKPAA